MKVELWLFCIQVKVHFFWHAVLFFAVSARILRESLLGWAPSSEKWRSCGFVVVLVVSLLIGSWLSIGFSVVVIEALHDFFEFLTFDFLLFFYLFDFFFVFLLISVIVKVDFGDWGEIGGRLNLEVEELFVLIFAKPRMGKNFLHSMDGAKSLFGLFAQKAFQKIFALRSQGHIRRIGQLLRQDSLINLIRIPTVIRWQSSQQLIQKRTHTIKVNRIGMSNSELVIKNYCRIISGDIYSGLPQNE